MRPIVNGLRERYGKHVDFVYLNARDGAQGEAAFEFYSLRGHPSLVFVTAEGEVSWVRMGVVARAELAQVIEEQVR